MNRVVVVALMAVMAMAAACRPEPRAQTAGVHLGDAARGRRAVERYGCGGCHTIPAVRLARGNVGPSLAGLATRPYLAGSLVNEPANLIEWVQHPRRLVPSTVMPNLAVSEADARDIAAFLYRPR